MKDNQLNETLERAVASLTEEQKEKVKACKDMNERIALLGGPGGTLTIQKERRDRSMEEKKNADQTPEMKDEQLNQVTGGLRAPFTGKPTAPAPKSKTQSGTPRS